MTHGDAMVTDRFERDPERAELEQRVAVDEGAGHVTEWEDFVGGEGIETL